MQCECENSVIGISVAKGMTLQGSVEPKGVGITQRGTVCGYYGYCVLKNINARASLDTVKSHRNTEHSGTLGAIWDTEGNQSQS